MAADLLPPDKIKPDLFAQGDLSAKDKIRPSSKTDSGRFKSEEGTHKKGIKDGLQRSITF
jgi:hypothetical protein